MNRQASIALAFLLHVTAPLFAQTSQTPPLPSVKLPAELARVLTDYEKAWTARDANQLASLFAEDGFVLSTID